MHGCRVLSFVSTKKNSAAVEEAEGRINPKESTVVPVAE
jgi:hypothetical protein